MEDKDLLQIHALKWLPWVGSRYSTSASKILIVGESHYSEDTPEKLAEFDRVETTRESIQDMGVENNSYGVKFYQNLHYLLVTNNSFNTEALWSRVAFYNFIQKTMHTQRSRPEYIDYHNSAATFFSLIENLSPNYCLMCGVSSVNAIKNTIESTNFKITSFEEHDKIGNIYPRTMQLKGKSGALVNLVFIQHPSHHFSYNNWNQFLRENSPDILNQFSDL